MFQSSYQRREPLLFQSFQYPLFVQHKRLFNIGADFSSLLKKFKCQFCQFYLCVSCSALRTQDQSQEQVISKLTKDIEQKRHKKQKTKKQKTKKQKQTEEQKQTRKQNIQNQKIIAVSEYYLLYLAQWLSGSTA